MQYRNLGRSGLKVSEISLGSWRTYGNSTEATAAEAIIDRGYELGVDFFDTANVYAQGAAEKIVGKALARYPRESFVLATKVYFPMGDGPNDRGLSRKHIMEQAHLSLKRLNMDYVDIYYCHRYDDNAPIEETLRALDDLLRQGKALYIGISEWTGAQIERAMAVADRYLLDRVVVNQPQYSMLYRNIEADVLPVSKRYGVGQVVFSPLAQGILTGKYHSPDDFPPDSRAADPKSNQWILGLLTQANLDRVEKLKPIAAGLGVTLSQLALAWVLREPGISSALVGASRVSQLEDNVGASGVVIPPADLAKIEEILK